MKTRTFNQVSAIVFGALTVAMLVAGFFNPVHFLLASCSATLLNIAVNDDSEGQSLLDEWER